MTLPDVETLQLCSMLASSAYSVAFIALWLRHPRDLHYACWGISALIYGLIVLAYSTTTLTQPALSAFLFGLLGLSNILPYYGVLCLDGRRTPPKWLLVPTLSPALGYCLPLLLIEAGWLSTPADSAIAICQAAGLAVSAGVGGIALGFGRGAGEFAGRRLGGLAMLAYFPGYALAIVGEIWVLPGREWIALLAMLSDQVLLGVLNLGLLAIPVERAQRLLRQAALRDPLTGVWNRAGLEALTPCFLVPGTTVIAIDVDHFKRINDRNGHAVGDAVLALIGGEAQWLAGTHRGEMVRMGGDEFALLLPPHGQRSKTIVDALGSRLLAKASASGIAWTVSCGVGLVASGDADLAPALGRADRSLYQAKARREALAAA